MFNFRHLKEVINYSFLIALENDNVESDFGYEKVKKIPQRFKHWGINQMFSNYGLFNGVLDLLIVGLDVGFGLGVLTGFGLGVETGRGDGVDTGFGLGVETGRGDGVDTGFGSAGAGTEDV